MNLYYMSRIYKLIFIIIGLLISYYAESQGVAINNSGNIADTSAILDIASSNKGVLFPRLTETERNNIFSPAEGLMIFNTTSKCVNIYKNNAWFEFCGTCVPPSVPILNSNGPLCEGDTLYLNATSSPGATYSWSGPDGFLSGLQNPAIPSVTLASSGTYSVTADNGLCSSSNTIDVVISSIPVATFTTSPINPSDSQNVTFYPDEAGATSYSWQFENGNPSTSTDENPVVQWYALDTFNVILTVNNNGCSATDTSQIIISPCAGGSQPFNYTGSIQDWVVPACISQIVIEVVGASGGNAGNTSGGVSTGGKGARMIGTFNVTPGSTLKVLVGQKGEDRTYYIGGGGGGSFVWVDGASDPLIIAGGGGGAGGQNGGLNSYHNGIDALTTQNGTNGNGATSGAGTSGNGGVTPSGYSEFGAGGCGWYSNGAQGQACGNAGGGVRPLAGGQGGLYAGNVSTVGSGGFGGGGGGQGACNAAGGGGGGGYSGGGGGVSAIGPFSGGGGAGSFNSGTSQSNTAGYNTGNGYVIITY